MLISNHVVAGAAIGALAPGPVSAFTAGVASHFAMDAVPHFGVDEEHFMAIAVPDGLVGLALMGSLFARAPGDAKVRVLAGMLGACAPDADKPGKVFFGGSPFPAAIDAFHASIQREHSSRWVQELALIGGGLVLARVLVSRAALRPRR